MKQSKLIIRVSKVSQQLNRAKLPYQKDLNATRSFLQYLNCISLQTVGVCLDHVASHTRLSCLTEIKEVSSFQLLNFKKITVQRTVAPLNSEHWWPETKTNISQSPKQIDYMYIFKILAETEGIIHACAVVLHIFPVS